MLYRTRLQSTMTVKLSNYPNYYDLSLDDMLTTLSLSNLALALNFLPD